MKPFWKSELTFFEKYHWIRVGVVFALLHSLTSSLYGVIIHDLSHIPAVTINLYQHIICFVVTCPIVVFNNIPLFPYNYRSVLILRSISSCVNVTLLFISFKYIPFSDSTAISFTSVAITVLLARIFLGEACNLIQIIVIVLSFSGVLLICRPTFLFRGFEDYDGDTMIGVSMALLATVLLSVSAVSMRAMKKLQTITIMINFFLVSVVCLAVITTLLQLWVLPENLYECFLLFSLAFVSLLSTAALTLAFRFEPAGVVSTVTTSEIVFSYSWQFFLWDTTIHWESLLGAMLILSATLMSSLCQRYTKEDKSTYGNLISKTIYRIAPHKDSIV